MKFVPRAMFVGLVLVLLLMAAPGLAADVTVKADPQLPAATVESVRQAAQVTTEFYKTKYGLSLEKSVDIVLVVSQEDFRKALIDVLKISPGNATKQAKHVKGVSAWNIVSYGITDKSSVRDIYRHIAHEMTHTYQRQLATTKAPGKMTWLWEGMANTIAAQIVEEQGIRKVAETRRGWVNYARKQAVRPGLKILSNQEEWFRAIEMYGIDNVYNVATLAVDYLMQKKGYSALFDYVRATKTAPDGAAAFSQAFGLELNDFVVEFSAYLNEQLTQ